MTGRPTRATPAGRVYLDLRKLAQDTGRPTDELFQLYALEGFLDRLTRSDHVGRFVLKGGVLLAAFDTRRPTRDIDLVARALDNDATHIRTLIADVAAIHVDDGLEFDHDSVFAETIRDDDLYSGARVTISGTLATARIRFHVDVNVGDPITPLPGPVNLPRLLGGAIEVVGYPIEMVLAEKIVTAIQRGTANSRWRDFTDIALLVDRHTIDGTVVTESVVQVAAHRNAQLAPLAEVLAGYPDLAQARWAAWRRKQRLDDRVPQRFDDLLHTVIGFADPVILGVAATKRWDAPAGAWS